MEDLTDSLALALWSEFPVNADPRPLVLLSPRSLSPRFRTGEAKLAYLKGALVSQVDLPPGVLAALRPHPRARHQTSPITVLAVERVTHAFWTDRGLRPLPAYRVEIEDALDPAYVLDPEVGATAWWPAGLDLDLRWVGGSPAVLESNGRTLVVPVIGALPEYSEVQVSAVLETRTAVLILTEETMHDGLQAVPLVAAERPLRVTLTEPLGARVLVQPYGQPLAVVPA